MSTWAIQGCCLVLPLLLLLKSVELELAAAVDNSKDFFMATMGISECTLLR